MKYFEGFNKLYNNLIVVFITLAIGFIEADFFNKVIEQHNLLICLFNLICVLYFLANIFNHFYKN